MRENAELKGRRYLVEARLLVTLVDQDRVEARCRGDSGEVYRLGLEPTGRWWCSCPALGRCAHLVGLKLVTVSNRRPSD
jgi:hypothetical protein